VNPALVTFVSFRRLQQKLAQKVPEAKIAGITSQNHVKKATERKTKMRKLIAVTALAMITASVNAADPVTIGHTKAKALALYAPRPQYPIEARSRHETGLVVVVVDVDPVSGNVVSASILRSSGWVLLDYSAVSAFRQWRFRPGTVSKVRIPVTFSMR
jgi:TonB family protein